MKPGDTVDLFVEQVTHIDCGVLDPDTGLDGRTWLVDARLSGTRDAHGMLFDFGPARRLLKRAIDERLDHRLLVPLRVPGLSRHGDDLRLTTTRGAHIDYAGPAEGVALLDAERIGPALLADWLTDRIAPLLPDNIDDLQLSLRAEAIDGAAYHYCHGLRSHDGNCQRMGHGHRCRLAIAVDGRDDPARARRWAEGWQGVFIGDRADLARRDADGRHHFDYVAPQGRFALTIDAGRCVLLDGPPTVENVAAHIADTLAAELPDRHLEVRAYEGVGKGAIVCRGPA